MEREYQISGKEKIDRPKSNWQNVRGNNFFSKVYYFYLDGIRSMTIGRTLWALVIIKLFIMFAILRVFFFPRHMGHLKTQEDKADYVIEQLSDF